MFGARIPRNSFDLRRVGEVVAIDRSRPSTVEVRWGWVAAFSFVFVVAAVILELAAGSWSNSQVPGWADGLVPLTWPQPARFIWWTGVALAVLTFRVGLAKVGLPTRRWITALLVVPFIVFALGLALGAEWSTFH